MTLTLHEDGKHRNEIGASAKLLYLPLLEKFSGRASNDDFKYGLDENGRCYIEDRRAIEAGEGRLLPYLVWMEDWGTSWSGQFARGKLFYRKAGQRAHFARQYKAE